MLNFVNGALNNNLGAVSKISCNGGTLQWATGNSQDVSGSNVNISGSNQTAYFDVGNNSVTFANGISGNGGVNKLGNGTLTYSVPNTYTGGTTVTAGTLALTYVCNGNSTAVPGVLTIQPGATVNAMVQSIPWNAKTTTAININGGSFNSGVSAGNGMDLDGITINMTGGTLGSIGGGKVMFNSGAPNGVTTINVLPSTITSFISGPANVNSTGPTINVSGGTAPGGIDLLVTTAFYSFTKTGSGTMLMAGPSNPGVSAPVVSNGVLLAGTNDAFSSNGVVLGDSNTTAFNSSPSILIDGPYSVTKQVTVGTNAATGWATTGTYTIGGNTTYSSTLSSGVNLDNNVTVTQASGGTLNINGGNWIPQGAVTGTQTVTFAGPGVVVWPSNAGYLHDGSLAVTAVRVTGGLVYLHRQSYNSGLPTISGGTVNEGSNQGFGLYETLTMGDSYTTTYNTSPTFLVNQNGEDALPITVANQATTGTYTIGGVYVGGTSLLSRAITINNNLTFSEISGGTLNLQFGSITIGSGANVLTFAGPGVTTLNDTTTVNAPLTVSVGTGPVNIGGTVYSNSGSLNFAQASGGTLNFNAGAISTQNSSGTQTVTFGGQGAINLNSANGINNGSGTVAVSVTSGLVTFNSYNSYSGGTTVSGGTLVLANPSGGGNDAVPGVLTIQPGATVNATANALGWYGSYTSAINVNGSSFNTGYSGLAVDSTTINLTGGTLGSFNSGTLGFSTTQNGPGTVVNVLPSAVTSLISAPISVNNFGTNPNGYTQPNFNVSGGSTASGIDLLVTAPISWQIIKSGSGTMALASSMTASNPIVSGGALIAQCNDAFGPNGIVLGDSNTTTNNASPSALIGGPYSITHNVTINSNATTGTYTIGGNTTNSSSFTGAIYVNNNLTVAQSAGGTLNIYGGVSPTVSGTQTITFAGPGAINVAVPGITNSNNGNISNGAGTVAVKVTGGLVTFGNPENYAGGTTVSGGTLALGGSFNNGQYATIVGTLNVNSGAMVDALYYAAFGWWSPDPTTRLSTVNINGGLMQNDSGAFVNLNGVTINMTGGTIASGDGTNGFVLYNFGSNGPSTVFNILPSTNTAIISAPIHPNTNGGNTGDSQYQIFNVGTGTTASGVDLLVTAPVNYSFIKRGNGTMELTATSGYNGGTLPISAGTVIAGTNDPLGNSPGFGTTLALGDSATTVNNSSVSVLIGGPYTLSNWINVTANATTGTYTLGGNMAYSSTFTGKITASNNLSIVQAAGGAVNFTGGIVSGSGAQTITFVGPGAMNVNTTPITDSAGTIGVVVNGGVTSLNAPNTYSGNTTILGGALVVGGSLNASGNVYVNGGTLSGGGAVGNLYVNGNTLAPGNVASAGTLTATTLTISNNSVLDYTLGSGTSDGLVIVSGALSLTGTGVTLDVTPGSGWTNGTYELASYGGALSGAGNLSTWTVAGGGSHHYSFTASGGSLDVNVTPAVTTVTGTWNNNGGGSWSTAGNWTGSQAPTTTNDTALFGPVVTSGTATVSLDGSHTLSGLTFNDTTGSYSITTGTGGNLTLVATSGAVTLANSGGSHSISASVALGSNLCVATAVGSKLTISGPVTQLNTGTSLNLSGSGTLVLSGSDSYSGGTTVNAGTLDVISSQALPTTGTLVIGRNGHVVLGNITGAAALAAASPFTSESISLATVPALSSVDSSVAVQASSPAVQVSVPTGAPVSGGPAAVPEPGTVLMLLVGAAVLAVWRRKKGLGIRD